MGVKLIDLAEGDRVVAVAKLSGEDVPNGEAEPGEAAPGAPGDGGPAPA